MTINAAKFDRITSYRWSSQQPEDQFPVEDPATGELITIVQGGGEAEVNAAVEAAHAAFNNDWRWRAPRERGRLLQECANILRAHADELAELESREVGKPFNISRPYDVENAIWSFEYFGGLADKLLSGGVDFGPIDVDIYLEPHGVVGGIIPFNWPPIHTGAKTAPALAVGNTIVLKPGEQAPLVIMRMVELINTVLPPDVVHAVPGHGPRAGSALAAHKLVRKISFTGSTATGAAVLKLAANNITPALLELGGKNPFVVFEDADLDLAVRGALEGAYYNQGEACTAASRLIVHRSLYDRFNEKLADAVTRLKVGSSDDPGTHVGPVVTRAHQQRVLNYIKIGVEEGATIAAQAPLSSDPALKDGFFVPPTLFTGVHEKMRIAQEEIFGPVTCVIPFDTFDDAIRIANDSPYGLVSAIYTRDPVRINRASRRIEAGIVFVNNYNRALMGTPFGGVKGSGYGREHCIDTLREFGHLKAVRQPSGEGEIPSWAAVKDIFGA